MSRARAPRILADEPRACPPNLRSKTLDTVKRLIAVGVLSCLACAESVSARPDASLDAGSTRPAMDAVEAMDGVVPDELPGRADTPDDAPLAADVTSVRTCSELVLREVTATPGRPGVAYPGSRIVLRGDDLASIDRVTVGGVEMPFERVGDAISTAVPPMLEVGRRSVIVSSLRCSASADLTVSRLVARIPREGGRVALLDWAMLDDAGALDTGLAAIEQAAFTMDGASLIVRDRDGRMAVAWVSDGRVDPLPWRARGPFTLAQGTVVPTQGLLVVPSGTPAGMLRIDTETRRVTPYEGPSSDPVGVATTLDGFRALVLDRAAVNYALNRPFARTPAWSRLGEVAGLRRPAQIILEQGGAVTVQGPLAAIYDATEPPALIPMDSTDGCLGARVEIPGAAGGAYFLSGDVVAMDSTTNEVITFDIVAFEGLVFRQVLAGEAPAGITRTQTAITLYKLGAVTLRPSRSGVPEGAALHVVDYHREPAVEERQVAIPGLRGVAGLYGPGNPFVVWTAREVIRVRGDDGVVDARRALAPSDGDLGLVVVHR